jgi:hypothetical protein
VTIHANGSIIGAINEWNPEQTLAVNGVYEFGSVTGPYGTEFGAPYEKVPGNIGGMTVRVRRYDVYASQMETAFGTLDLTMLSGDPGVPNGGTGHLDVRERWTLPASASSSAYDNVYQGCWFSNIGRTLSTTGDRIVNVNATLEYTRRLRVTR